MALAPERSPGVETWNHSTILAEKKARHRRIALLARHTLHVRTRRFRAAR